MKLVIQIPCLNEERTLPATLAALPRQIEGVDTIEVLVIDDGSTDRTAEVALAHGAHVVRFRGRRGLAKAFSAGLDAALRLGADAIVNTDGDNQYQAADFPILLQPLLHDEADMVVGDRQVAGIAHFSPFKRRLQRLGSWVVRKASNLEVADATSGFRAFSKDAALRLNVLSTYSYTLETLIQAGQLGLRVASVPVRTNPPTRPSRLFRSMVGYVFQSTKSIVLIYSMYQPLRVCLSIGAVVFSAGFALGARFCVDYLQGDSAGKLPSLVIGAVLMLVGCQTAVTGLLADLIGRNRQLSEATLWRLRRLELESRQQTPAHATALRAETLDGTARRRRLARAASL